MTETSSDNENDSSADPNLKEQDEGIIEAFTREGHQVLTTTEITEHVSISERQVRRRLDKLADRGIIGKRVVSGVKMAWLEEDVREPITVRYPLLTYVRDRASVQMFLFGIAFGIVSLLVLFAASLSIWADVSLVFIESDQLLLYGVLGAIVAASLIIVALLMALVGKLLRFYEVDIQSKIESLDSEN